VSASVIPPSHDHTSDDAVRATPHDGERSLVASSASAASVDHVVVSDARDEEDSVPAPLSSSSPRRGTKRPRDEAASSVLESPREEEEEEVSDGEEPYVLTEPSSAEDGDEESLATAKRSRVIPASEEEDVHIKKGEDVKRTTGRGYLC
jgi:hypothetical protein